jgi:leucyl-tRNA synthetase
LFLGPYPQGGDFRDSGMQGMSRFLNRVYNLAQKAVKRPGLPGKTGSSGINPELNQKLHQTIKKVQKDIQNLKFNTSIAAIMELTNLWQEKIKGSNKDFVGVYARLIAPFTPFLSEELWQMADGTGSVLGAGWPKYEANIAKEAKKTIVVQINGKLKAKLEMAADQASQKDQVLAEIDKNNQIQEFLAGKKPKKTIFIPAKLVNLVV